MPTITQQPSRTGRPFLVDYGNGNVARFATQQEAQAAAWIPPAPAATPNIRRKVPTWALIVGVPVALAAAAALAYVVVPLAVIGVPIWWVARNRHAHRMAIAARPEPIVQPEPTPEPTPAPVRRTRKAPVK